MFNRIYIYCLNINLFINEYSYIVFINLTLPNKSIFPYQALQNMSVGYAMSVVGSFTWYYTTRSVVL